MITQRMTWRRAAGRLVVGFLVGWLGAQGLVVLQAQSQAATHVSTGGTLPATCRVGDSWYKTGPSAGLYLCTAANTWTITGGGGGGTVTTTGSPASGDVAQFSGATSITNAAVTGTGSVVRATSPSITTPTLTGPVTLAEAVGSSGLTITGATQTASFPALNITQAWNNSGVTFTGLKFNATSTASASGSLLLNLQTGGVSQFAVRKDGYLIIPPAAFLVFGNGDLTGVAMGKRTGLQVFTFFNEAINNYVSAGGSDFGVLSTGKFGWSSTTSVVAPSSYDTYFSRDAAGIIAQRNGTNPQAFRIYNTYTDASNYERLNIQWSGNVASLGMTAAGTGSARAFSLLDEAGTAEVTVNSSTSVIGVLLSGATFAGGASTRHRVAIGNGGAINPLSGTAGDLRIGSNYSPASTSTMVAYPLYINPTINYSAGTPGAGSYEALKIAVTETALPTGQSYLARWSAGASGTTDIWRMTNKGVQIQAGVAADPTTTIVGTSDFAIYRKNSKFVIAYNNAGTMTYLTIPLDAATATWTQSTSAP